MIPDFDGFYADAKRNTRRGRSMTEEMRRSTNGTRRLVGADPDGGHAQAVCSAQILQHVVDHRAAVRVEIVLAQQIVEAVQRRLAPIAGVLERVDARRNSGRGRCARSTCQTYWRGALEKISLVPPRRSSACRSAFSCTTMSASSGKTWVSARNCRGCTPWRRIRPFERGAVGAPEVLAHRVRAGLVEVEHALQEGVDLVVHRREDARPGVVQRVVEVEDPHPPGRRQPRDSHVTCFL